MELNVDYFIRKFEASPENKWGIYALGNCAYTQCNYIERRALSGLFETIRECSPYHLRRLKGDTYCGYSWLVCDINDGGGTNTTPYTQATPKQRILAALQDIKAKQEGEAAVKEAEKIISQPLNIEVCSTQ